MTDRLLIETEHILEGIGFNWELSHRHRIARELIAKIREMTLGEVGEWLEKMLRLNAIRGSGLRSELGKLSKALKQGKFPEGG